jgi:hypothetical protein
VCMNPKEPMKMHALRISEDLWQAAQAKADADGEYLSEVIRRLLEDYVNDKKRAGTS